MVALFDDKCTDFLTNKRSLHCLSFRIRFLQLLFTTSLLFV